MFRLIGFVCVLLFASCTPASEQDFKPAAVDLRDSTYQQIINYQSEQNTPKLLEFLRAESPSYRLAVANAFASYQDVNAVDSLVILLQDDDKIVRQSAAYSLGQIGDEKAESALIQAFIQKDTSSINSALNATILEAIGKTGTKKSLDQISTVKSYRKDSDQLILGQVRAIYRFMIRGIVSETGTQTAVKYATDDIYPLEGRLVAAHYLARLRDQDLSMYKFRITNALLTEEDANVRMALATACNKFEDDEVFESLKTQLEKETNDFVKCNLLRSMSKYPYAKVMNVFLSFVDNKNPQIASIAADYIINNGTGGEALTYAEMARQAKVPVIKAKLFQASLKNLPGFFVSTRTALINEIKSLLKEAPNAYTKANYFKALCGDVRNYTLIKDIGITSEEIPLRTASFEAMEGILNNPKFKKYYNTRSKSRYVKRQFIDYMKTAFEGGDVALLSLGANMLMDESHEFKGLVKDTIFLENARGKLKLPQELEAYNDLTKALNYLFDNNKYEAYNSDSHKPLNWALLRGVSDSTIARIVTDKGDIDFKLLPELSPETVANFIDLANNNYFDNKNFHRVVANFVIQGGCSRGDGYSGMDYTIRSELGQKYYDKAGMVGMASAGLHTESSQFFITHSPAPHLDGRYTIFGEVVKGLDIVNQVQVGDLIKDVQIIK